MMEKFGQMEKIRSERKLSANDKHFNIKSTTFEPRQIHNSVSLNPIKNVGIDSEMM